MTRFSANPFSRIAPKKIFGFFANNDGIKALQLLSDRSTERTSSKFQAWLPIIEKMKDAVGDKTEPTIEDLKNAQRRWAKAKKSRREGYVECIPDEQLEVLIDYVGTLSNPVFLRPKQSLDRNNFDNDPNSKISQIATIDEKIIELKKTIHDAQIKIRELKRQKSGLKWKRGSKNATDKNFEDDIGSADDQRVVDDEESFSEQQQLESVSGAAIKTSSKGDTHEDEEEFKGFETCDLVVKPYLVAYGQNLMAQTESASEILDSRDVQVSSALTQKVCSGPNETDQPQRFAKFKRAAKRKQVEHVTGLSSPVQSPRLISDKVMQEKRDHMCSLGLFSK